MGKARGSGAREDLRVRIEDGMKDSEDEKPQLDKKRKEREEEKGAATTENKKSMDGKIKELERQLRRRAKRQEELRRRIGFPKKK